MDFGRYVRFSDLCVHVFSGECIGDVACALHTCSPRHATLGVFSPEPHHLPTPPNACACPNQTASTISTMSSSESSLLSILPNPPS